MSNVEQQMSLSDIIEGVTGNERTLTVYDASDPGAVADVKRHFAAQQVEVREASAPEGPDDFAVLHEDGTFLAAADLAELRQAVTFQDDLLDATDFRESRNLEILKHVSDTTFTAYGKRRMILASREIEERAWHAGGGELHVGFQRLSLFRDQWDRYDRIGDRGVDVHVYGESDWQAPEAGWLTRHDSDAAEIRNTWFLAFDSPGDSDCVLLAEERDPNEYTGFWSYDPDIVGDVLACLRSAYG